MRTEQDYHLEEDTTVWTRFREPHNPDYLQVVYSDERPDYLAITLGTILLLLCIAVIMVLLYTAVG